MFNWLTAGMMIVGLVIGFAVQALTEPIGADDALAIMNDRLRSGDRLRLVLPVEE